MKNSVYIEPTPTTQVGSELQWRRADDLCKRGYSISNDNSFEGIFLEINLRKKKWLLCLSYNPKKILIETALNNISKVLDANLAKYDQYLLIGDLNSETTEPIMGEFCDESG